MILYGISNCDTVKKARNWLSTHQLDYKFHDVRHEGLSLALLQQLIARLDDWNVLINRKSATIRSFSPDMIEQTQKIETALPLLVKNPTLLKRPVLDTGNSLLIGFDVALYQKAFNC